MRPLLNKTNEWGRLNANSLAHGAGRAICRTHAATWVAQKHKGRTDQLLRGDVAAASGQITQTRRFAADGEDVEKKWSESRQINGGYWELCEDNALVWEEAPEAYKDVWEVGADLVENGAAEILGWTRGRVSYKVRNE